MQTSRPIPSGLVAVIAQVIALAWFVALVGHFKLDPQAIRDLIADTSTLPQVMFLVFITAPIWMCWAVSIHCLVFGKE